MGELKKIMFVEDDLTIYEMYKIKLEKEWFNILFCSNWLDALSKIVEYKPDLILLDIMMPTMDWFETLVVIKDLTTTIKAKILIFSNISSDKDIQKWLDLWADEYIVKANITPKELIEKINKHLSKNN